MSKPRKLKSGNWNIQVYDYTDENGKIHQKSVTAPTKAECIYQASLLQTKRVTKEEKSVTTVKDAIDSYIKLSEVLSPTTLSAYEKIKKYAFQSIMDLPVDQLNDCILQNSINIEVKRMSERTHKQLSAKTVKNEWGLVASALKTVCNKTYNVRLPKRQHENEDLPDPKAIMNIIKGTEVELPCLLAMWMSLRMSEVRGLMCSSVKKDVLYVDQVVVDVDGVPVRKQLAKTDKSIRKLQIPPYIKKLIENSGPYKEYKNTGIDIPLIPMTRNQIHHYYTRRMQKAGMDISFHDLRHVYASVCLNILQIPEKITMDIGGWSTPSVMKSVYSQSFSDVRQDADKRINAYFNSLL